MVVGCWWRGRGGGAQSPMLQEYVYSKYGFSRDEQDKT